MNFTDPLTREPMERSECLRLDQYLSAHSLRRVGVAEAYDLWNRMDDFQVSYCECWHLSVSVGVSL